ncbi:hypothetical protein NDN08_004962 [Rhodosorus marinus]|uniref:Uncharacterized protein n=1 Tax=Rhodosorus marinus TaxID=101924 RepID=A0AAV8UIW9_9RHOD|nr:hypothetical protein NDN08_004962 [Rhodosorus marinus]
MLGDQTVLGFLSSVFTTSPAFREARCRVWRGCTYSRRDRLRPLVKTLDSGGGNRNNDTYMDVDLFLSREEVTGIEKEKKVAEEDKQGIESFKEPPAPSKPERIQVITDIDDTVKSSGGLRVAGQYLGGIDSQYKRGDCYPGVFQFALEMATSGLPEDVEPLPMAVLTARARELKFALALEEHHPICRKYRYCGMERGFDDWGIGPVLYGSVKEWVFQSKKGVRKFRNFQLLHNYNASNCGVGMGCQTKYIYVGDTGELDLHAGKLMLQKYPSEMKAVFLHVVYNERDDPALKNYEDTHVKNVPVLFFRTYVGAARKAVEHGIISEAAMRRVAAKALKDLLRIEPDHSSSKWVDLRKDIKDSDLVPRRHWLWK